MAAPILLTAFGATKSVYAWARDPWCAVSVNTLKARLAAGVWSIEAAIATPGDSGQSRRGIPLSEQHAQELRDAAEQVRRNPKVHRHTAPDAPEAIAIRERDDLIRAAIGRGTSLSKIGRTVGLSGKQVAVIRDANQ